MKLNNNNYTQTDYLFNKFISRLKKEWTKT